MIYHLLYNHFLNHQPEKPNKNNGPHQELLHSGNPPLEPQKATASRSVGQPSGVGKIQVGQRKKMWVGCSYSYFF